MKKVLLWWLSMAVPVCVYADGFRGDIYSINPKERTITIASKQEMQTLRVRPGTLIKINDNEGKFEELNLGMKVRAVSADPTVATEIYATGIPSKVVSGAAGLSTPTEKTNATGSASAPGGVTNAAGQGKTLAETLAGSRWKIDDEKYFVLNPDGTVHSGWHKRVGHWRTLDDHTIELMVWHRDIPAEKATINPDATSLRWVDKGLLAYRIKE